VNVLPDWVRPAPTPSNVNLQSDVNVAIMSTGNEPTSALVRELSQAKNWPEQLKERLENGLDITDHIKEVDDKVEALEKRAREVTQELLNELVCGHPQTRLVFQAMVDMLIEWNIFKDSLEQ
jgi:hydroxylamine reductase (hybrid-cluster protein)